jgi:L-lactate dehydrogenase complex protein LldG
MDEITTPREQILKKVRAGLLNKFSSQFQDVEAESEVFYKTEDLAVAFAKSYTQRGGGLIYCHNLFDFHENLIVWMERRGITRLLVSDSELKNELSSLGLPLLDEIGTHQENCATLLAAEAIIARNGGITFSSKNSQRDFLTNSPNLLIFAKLSSLGSDMRQALVIMKNRYGEKQPSLISFVQGPTKSENQKEMVPRKEMVLFLVNDTLG